MNTCDTFVQDLCRCWHAQFGWELQTGPCKVLESWESRTAEFFVCEPAGAGNRVLIKAIVRGRIEPEIQATALNELRRMHRGAGGSVARPPKVFAWSECPAAVALEYIAGMDMPAMLGEALRTARGEELLTPLHVCGATLGCWHYTRTPSNLPGPLNREFSEALKQVEKAAARQRIPLDTAAARRAGPRLVRRYRDFGIYNFRVSPSGEVAVLDPPAAAVELDVPHRDVAWFLSTMDAAANRAIANKGSMTLSSLRRYDDLQVRWTQAFLGGYQAVTQQPLTAWDLKVIAVLESLFLLARSERCLRKMHLTTAFLHARLALRARRRAMAHP